MAKTKPGSFAAVSVVPAVNWPVTALPPPLEINVYELPDVRGPSTKICKVDPAMLIAPAAFTLSNNVLLLMSTR